MLRPGTQFNVPDLDAERTRISNLLRNTGLYYFRPDYLTYQADTTRTPGQYVSLRMMPVAGLPATAERPFHLGRKSIYLYGRNGQAPTDSLLYRNMYIYYHGSRPYVRPSMLYRWTDYRNFRFKRPQSDSAYSSAPRYSLYSLHRQTRIQERLAQTGIFRTTDIGFVPRDTSVLCDTLDINIRLMPQQYHDTYEEGQIISQQPAGGEKVQRGTDLWITVSMGPEPETKTMDDFAGASAEDASALLTNQGFHPLTKNEASDTVEKGLVIRTDPAAGADVKEGQTVYLYVSSGPAVVTATMPEVVGKDLELVKELMTQLGFQNVRYDPMESQKPKNEVIYQSVAKDTELDVTAEVIIQYSEGPAETQPPETTESTQDKEITITYPVDVPDRQVEYRLEVYLKGSTEVLTSKLVPPGTTRTYVDLTGSGTMEFDLYVDGAFLRTQTVEFTEESGDE